MAERGDNTVNRVGNVAGFLVAFYVHCKTFQLCFGRELARREGRRALGVELAVGIVAALNAKERAVLLQRVAEGNNFKVSAGVDDPDSFFVRFVFFTIAVVDFFDKAAERGGEKEQGKGVVTNGRQEVPDLLFCDFTRALQRIVFFNFVCNEFKFVREADNVDRGKSDFIDRVHGCFLCKDWRLLAPASAGAGGECLVKERGLVERRATATGGGSLDEKAALGAGDNSATINAVDETKLNFNVELQGRPGGVVV